MKKNDVFRFILCGLIILCTLFVMFSACTQNGGNQTAEPSANAYADPTEKATIVPITLQPTSPSPEPILTYDYEMLKAFFDMPSKVEGKTNGQILFKDYDPDNPYTWHLRTEKEHKEYVEYRESIDGEYYYDDEFILWHSSNQRDYSGYVEKIESYFFETENKMLNFGGTLLFDGFESLRSIELCNITADELIIENCNKLECVSIYSGLEKNSYFFEKVYINARISSSDIRPCAREFRLVVPAPEWQRDFDITALADGDGLVCVDFEPDEHLPNVVVNAHANPGSHFVGWYDEEGHLVSERERFMLTDYDYFDLFNDIATYTARFEKD